MFSEKLTTPHPGLIEPGTAPETLLQSKSFEAIQSDYENSSKTYDDSLEASLRIAELIRNTLEFKSHRVDGSRRTRQPELSPEALCDTHATNCHGHSIVVSECLETLAIDHRISFANLHSFVLMEDDSSGRIHMIDTPDSRLCLDITAALGGEPLSQHSEELGGANNLFTHQILKEFPPHTQSDILDNRPWLSFSGDRNGIHFWAEEKQNTASRLLMRHYSPQVGREILLSFTNLVHAIDSRDTSRAHEWMQKFDGTYPDIDKRNKLRVAKRLIHELGKEAIESALHDIQIVENSLTPFTDDLVLRLWPTDERRTIGANIKSASILRTTLEEYDKLYQDRKDARKSTIDIERRIRKAKKQLSAIE